MFKFIKNLFRKRSVKFKMTKKEFTDKFGDPRIKPLTDKIETDKFGIKPKVRAKAETDDDPLKHVRAGDYCNNCDVHVSKCPYWKTRQ